MSSLTVNYDDASLGLYHSYTPPGGLPDFLAKEFICHGNSLVAKINFQVSGSFTYIDGGTEYTVTDGTFSNNVLTELFTHGESDGDHLVTIPQANFVATTNSYTITSSGGTASFRKSDQWGEFADLLTNPATNSSISLPAYVTDHDTSGAVTTVGTYGNYMFSPGQSLTWKGTGSSIRFVGNIAVKTGVIELFRDGVSHAIFDLGASSLPENVNRLHTLFSGLDGTTEHEWRMYFSCGDVSIRTIMMGHTAGAGVFQHSPTFIPTKRLMVIGDSTSGGYGLTNFTLAWPYLVVTSKYAALTNSSIGGTSVRDYSGDGAPHSGDPLFTTASAEYRVEHTLKSLPAPDVVCMSDGANDTCTTGLFTSSCEAIMDDLATSFPAAVVIFQKGCSADTYDAALATAEAYGVSTYPGADIRLGARAAGITKADGIHPDAAGSVTIANQWLSAFGTTLDTVDTTPPTVSTFTFDSTGLAWTMVMSEACTGVDNAIAAGDFRLSTLQGLSGGTTADGGITWTGTCDLIYKAQTPTLRYLDGDGFVADLASNLLLTFSGASVTNGSSVICAVPTGLTATGYDGKIRVRWANNTEPVIGSYKVYTSASSGGTYVLAATVTTNTALLTEPNDTAVYIKITSLDTAGNESAKTSSVNATPTAAAGNEPRRGRGQHALAPTVMHLQHIQHLGG